jgi:hypothetical protein
MVGKDFSIYAVAAVSMTFTLRIVNRTEYNRTLLLLLLLLLLSLLIRCPQLPCFVSLCVHLYFTPANFVIGFTFHF